MYVGENMAFSRRFLLDGRQMVNPTVSQNAGARCAVPTQQAQRERGGMMSCANMPPHVEVSLRKGVCVCVYVCINP